MIEISTFLLNLIIFICGFSTKVTIAHFLLNYYEQWKSYLNKIFFESEDDRTFNIFDQIKVSRVPL